MAKKKPVKPDASTERGAGAQDPKAVKQTRRQGNKPDASTERGVGGQPKKVPPLSDRERQRRKGGSVDPGAVGRGKGRGKKKIDPAKQPGAGGETDEQRRKREAAEESAAQLEQDAQFAKTEMDYYLRNAWPDPADREQLLNLVTGAVRNKQLYVGSQNFTDQVWGLIETTPQYATRFPGLVARKNSSANGQVPMTPGDYMKMEDMFDAALSTYMIPPGVMDRRSAIAKMVENDVTVQEMEARIDLAAEAATQDESFLRKFSEYQGMTPGHLIAFYLDPDMTAEKIAKQERVFKVGAMMDRYGFAGAKADAQALADAGLSESGVMSSLDKAAQKKALMSGFGATVSESELLQGSASEGTASANVAKVAAQRAGRFNTAGGAAESQKGVTGLGASTAT
jgi:hypothetical protein